LIQTDVLVIGSGGAGCSAALEALKVCQSVHIITKGDFLNSKTSNAQGGIQAAMGVDDSPTLHQEDTLRAGEYQNNIKLVEILTTQAQPTIKWLESLGVIFDRVGSDYLLQKAAGLSQARILSCGDKSGNRLMGPMKQAIQESNVQVLEYAYPKEFIVDEVGFKVLIGSRFNNDQVITAKSIVLACGGYVAPEKRTGIEIKNNIEIPDIYDLIKDIGINVVYPDLVQYHPTGIVNPKQLRRERIPETVRSAGATLLNKNLEEFCDSLATRNKLTKIIIEECKKGNGISTDDGRVGVWLNTPIVEKNHGTGYYQERFPSLNKKFLDLNIDISKEMVLVFPILHYSLGGIEINEKTETNVKGIFAAGEATYGVHGKDRLMGNSLLDIFVFGRLAGKSAAMNTKGNQNN